MEFSTTPGGKSYSSQLSPIFFPSGNSLPRTVCIFRPPHIFSKYFGLNFSGYSGIDILNLLPYITSTNMAAQNGHVKHFVLDTNVLLHNPNALFMFADNEVIIPFDVIEELDKFKTGSDDLGRNARTVIRYLDSLRMQGNLSEGVDLIRKPAAACGSSSRKTKNSAPA